jgi:nicotinamide phosphoribosyltransferase
MTIEFKPEYLLNLTDNIILDADSYKASHFAFLEKDTKTISEYIEARLGAKYDAVVVTGVQPFNKRYMMKPITHL